MSTVGGRTVADWLLLLRVAVASLAGGLFAIVVLWVLNGDRVRPGLLLLLVLLVTALIVLALAALVSDRRIPAPPGGGGPPQPRPPGSRPAPAAGTTPVPDYRHNRAAPGRGPAASAPALPTALPVFTPPAPVRRRTTAPPTVETHPVPGAPPAATAVRRIVQCPHCGDFSIDLHREAALFAFTCRRCAHAWTWMPGRPWPATVVRPPGAERGLPPDPVTRRRSP